MSLIDLMCQRKSHRSYSSAPVSEEAIRQILIAGGLAPLGMPKAGKPHLTVVTDSGILKELAHAGGSEKDMIYGAPCLIVVSTPVYPAPGIDYANAGCVIENMALEATELGLASIYLYGVCRKLADSPELMTTLRLPAGYTPVSALAVGTGTEAVGPCKEAVPHLDSDRI